MKKNLLSVSVIGLFAVFSIYDHIAAQNPQIANQNNSQPDTSVNIRQPAASAGTPPPSSQNLYKNGVYVGDITDAYYGNVQVQATISGGQITDIQFLSYPNDRQRSIMINSMAMPILKSEAIQSQNANVDTVSGATDTSQAFIASLTSALTKAH